MPSTSTTASTTATETRSTTRATGRRGAPTREIRTRRIAFRYPDDELPRHFAGADATAPGDRGDLVLSHVIAVLSSLFPEGEDFFVASVRRYRDRITDPELTKQVAGFIGQEAIHGREHREFNDRLQALGYPTHHIDRNLARLLTVGQKVLPGTVQLAITSALEHYTATLAETLMTSEQAREELPVDEIRQLLLWHALEESEHKAVAFDVYQQVSGNHLVRSGTMYVVTFLFLLIVALETGLSLVLDPAARNPRRLARSLARARRSPFLTRDVARRIHDYHRRDFHPDDHETDALLASWREALFGTDGTLADRLKTRPAGAPIAS